MSEDAYDRAVQRGNALCALLTSFMVGMFAMGMICWNPVRTETARNPEHDGFVQSAQEQALAARAACVEWIAVLRPTGEVPRTCPGGHVEFTPSAEGPVACCRCERSP